MLVRNTNWHFLTASTNNLSKLMRTFSFSSLNFLFVISTCGIVQIYNSNFILLYPLPYRVAKSTAESAKNVINITKTVTERQQMRAVSVFYHGMFNFEPFTLPDNVLSKSEINEDSGLHKKLKSYMSDSDVICSNVVANNQAYKTGDLVVLEITDCDNLSVGLIQAILIKLNKVYFVIKRYSAIRKWLQYFESEKKGESVEEFVDCNRLVDYKPVIKRGTTEKFIFILHHHISFEYQ